MGFESVYLFINDLFIYLVSLVICWTEFKGQVKKIL